MNTFVLGTSLFFMCFAMISCSSFGSDPEGEHLQKIQESPQYDKKKEKFVNRREAAMDKMRENMSMWKAFKEFAFGSGNRVPKKKLPEIKPPDIKEFLQETDGIKFIWFGHSTILVNYENTIILFDPVLSGSAAPFSFLVQRFQPPILKATELPKIDYVVISHDHYDHLDMETIQSFKDKKTKFVTPLGVTSHIKSWGIPQDRLLELDWWESTTLGNLEFICTPAQHFSGRAGSNEAKTLWGSWVVKSETHRLYFSGDSGYDIHFKQIGDKYGPFDVAFVENGQYNKMWHEVHLLPEETAQAFLDLKGKKMVPIHWAMFELSLHDWYEPIVKSEENAKKLGIDLLTPKFGQIVSVTEENIFERWWQKFLPTVDKK
ncbi:MAG: MBL fold metallo-hydrolase [Spirochaetota bacterium]